MPIALGLVGVIVGSFLNVLIYRVPARRSIVRPASACPHCAQPIKARDNIPLVSWLVLRGRCRNCAEPISARYPLVELATALAFGLVAWWASATGVVAFDPAVPQQFAASIVALVALLFLAAQSIVLAAIDIDTRTLPNRVVLPTLGVAIVLLSASSLLAGNPGQLARAAIGMLGLGVIYAVIAFAYPGGMGFGDVKLALVLGLYLGWFSWGVLAVGAFAAFLFGALWGIGLIATRRGGRKTSMPFGPWMLVGAWAGILAGDAVADAYLALAGLT